jgi:hypothetical protein
MRLLGMAIRSLKLTLFYVALAIFARKYVLNSFEFLEGRALQREQITFDALASDTVLFNSELWFRQFPYFVLHYPDHEQRLEYYDFMVAIANYRSFEMFRHWDIVPTKSLASSIRRRLCDPAFLSARLPHLHSPPPSLDFQYPRAEGEYHVKVVCNDP